MSCSKAILIGTEHIVLLEIMVKLLIHTFLYYLRNGRVGGRKAKTREATKTIHRQHQTVNTKHNGQHHSAYGLPKTAVVVRTSSTGGGQRSSMICGKKKTAHIDRMTLFAGM